MDISKTTAVITGGASGLGEATSRALATAGAKVAIFDMNEERGKDIAESLGGMFCNVDVTSDASVAAGFDKARQALGQERILVNCAGIGNAAKTVRRDRSTGEISQFPLGQFAKVIEINLIGTFRCIAASAAGMLTLEPSETGDRGAIVTTASVAAQDGQIGQAAYTASKAGVSGMTLPIARDLSNEGIRINCILPGIFNTPMMEGLPEPVRDALNASVPYPKRLGEPSEFAELAISMIRNSYLNGESIRLDGAIRMAPR